MERLSSSRQQVDGWLLIIYALMVLFGWVNIYAAVYDPSAHRSIFDLSTNSGKQLVWIFSGALLASVVMIVNFKVFEVLSYVAYAGMLLLLIGVLVFGREIAGSKSWFDFGFMRLQPAEFAKLGVSLAVARFLSDPNLRVQQWWVMSVLFILIAIPVTLILLQGDTGSAMVFAIFILVFYREGFPAWIMGLGLGAVILFTATLFLRENYLWHLVGVIGGTAGLVIGIGPKKLRRIIAVAVVAATAIALVLSVELFVTKVLKPHQQKRIEILINPDADPLGAGWQVTQSKIAIGSGGFWGKGFLEGTQTKFDFVPDQSTDFIFCTVGEEHGWIGSLVLIGLFVALLFRLLTLAERQKDRFARVYGYCVLSVFFFHFMVNIGMTIGLFPVIGIPLPFFSYGGSSLWAFTLLLFIFIKLDANRMQVLGGRG